MAPLGEHSVAPLAEHPVDSLGRSPTDATGNITGDGSVTFTYDARGRLTQATKGSVTQYAINGLGQRVAKTTTTAVPDEAPIVDSVLFVYDEAGHLLGEYGGTGAVIQETVWLEDLPVGVLTAGGQFYVNPDHLGAPLTVTDATGQIVWRWDRDPYGNGKPNENPNGVGTFTYNLRFPGQYYDKETELHYNYFRDYNPKTGRYVQADPVGLAGGTGIYLYALNSPLFLIDPLGLDSLLANGGILSHYNNTGDIVGLYPYTSGRDGVTDQAMPSKGPIPPGTYLLNPSQISEGGFFDSFLVTGGNIEFRLSLIHLQTHTEEVASFYMEVKNLGRLGALISGEQTSSFSRN